MMRLQDALTWLPGGRLVGEPATRVQRVHTDTRTLAPGDLFVALKGERHDANAFLADAARQGAVAAIAHHGMLPAGLPGIEVDDTRQALGALAAGWRSQFSLPLIAVTGSNGKTTVTQMIASILRAWRGEGALATQGNFNNDIGVPLTLLRLRATHQVGVVELGMNHPGEIAYLGRIARPTVALVNNAQREHLEFMATVEAVARENGEIIRALDARGVAVYPADEAFTSVWAGLAGERASLRFGATAGADILLAGTEWTAGHWQVGVQTPAAALAYALHIAGRHNVRNSLAAVACALAAGAPLAAIRQGLEDFAPVKGRSRAFSVALGARQLTVVDDTYNANPDSVLAAIDVLAELPGPRLLVLGDMGEVGDEGPRFHAEVGAHARAAGIERLFTLGEQSRAMGGRHFDDVDALNAAVRAELPATGSVLVKGSRFMKMERVVEAINASQQQAAEETRHAA
ncbi:MAG: UDP-N-acetylmuramoyl-tripeptide--D-alanyl-D-alanine ligase [Ramlibacter sp.]|nr:UDP-N-acetylmuramoyl-tripeptide--D-alanyl-D-alanine ligase [Ramlibacter sp.]